MKIRMIILALGSFIAGFLTCYVLALRQPASTLTPTRAPIAMLAPPSLVTTQTFQIDDGVWYHHSDGSMNRTPPPEMQMQPRSYDLIETRPSP